MGRSRIVLISASVIVVAAAAAFAIASAVGGSEASDPSPMRGSFADLQAHVSAINHEKRESDALPPWGLQALAAVPDEQLSADAFQDARRVFDGAVVGQVFVVPTKAGFAVVSRGGLVFVPGTLGDTNPTAGSVEQRSPADPVVVFGITTDDVVRVDVVAGGRTSPARLTENGYEWAADAPVAMDDVRLLVHLSDGRVVRG